VNEDTRATDPRSEDVGVGRLGPAGVRHVPVDVGRTQVDPVSGGDGVAETVAGTRHLRHLGVSGRAAREEHLHHVRAQRPGRLSAYGTSHHAHTAEITSIIIYQLKLKLNKIIVQLRTEVEIKLKLN